MLDIKFILENQDQINHVIANKNVAANLEQLVAYYENFRKLKLEIDLLKTEANQIAAQMVKVTDKQELIKKGTDLKKTIKEQEEHFIIVENLYKESLNLIPNVFAIDTPTGKDDNENVVIKHFMEPTTFEFTPKDHVELGESLDLINFEAGSKVAGPKFYFLKNEAVLLEMALKQFVIAKAMKAGFTIMQTPELAKNSILSGSGYAPRGNESNSYVIEGEDLSLIATSEIAIGGYHSGEVLDASKLPIKYAADSHCFRTEAGGAGRVSKGLYRVHQFSKIELYIFSKPEDSEALLEEILALEEEIYQDLKIPYRVMRICAGDLGAPAYKKYDIEAWMPGRSMGGSYGEVTSASSCTDFQARRLNIKYKNQATSKNEFVHTLNGTAIALSRTLIAVLENYQTKEGEILVPEVLRPLVSFNKITKKS